MAVRSNRQIPGSVTLGRRANMKQLTAALADPASMTTVSELASGYQPGGIRGGAVARMSARSSGVRP